LTNSHQIHTHAQPRRSLSAERQRGAAHEAHTQEDLAQRRRRALRREQDEERGQLRGGRDLMAAQHAKVAATLEALEATRDSLLRQQLRHQHKVLLLMGVEGEGAPAGRRRLGSAGAVVVGGREARASFGDSERRSCSPLNQTPRRVWIP
jgi:hypothetical protein